MNGPTRRRTYEKLERDVIALEDKIRKMHEDQHAISLKEIEVRWGVKPGAIVKVFKTLYKVSRIDYYGWPDSKPTLRGYIKKANGDWGRMERRCGWHGGWELVEKALT